MATMMKPMDVRHWQDWVDIALGLLILASPWVLGLTEMMPVLNAVVVGLVVLGLSALALGAFRDWEEWLNVACGVWIAASPWIFGYSSHAEATGTHLLLGLMVAGFAISELRDSAREQSRG